MKTTSLCIQHDQVHALWISQFAKFHFTLIQKYTTRCALRERQIPLYRTDVILNTYKTEKYFHKTHK